MSIRDKSPLLSAAGVFVIAFAWFSWRAAHAWLVSGYVDPVSLYGAQDEGTYSRIVLEMVERGNWLAPTFLDRLAFFKPPLLYWLSAASVKLFGISAYALRLPSILAAAGTCAVAFRFVARTRGTVPGLVAAILIASNYYWILLGSLNMTDGLLVFFTLTALFAVARDPALGPRTLAITSITLGAAVLTKTIAALPALAVLVGFSLMMRAAPRRLTALTIGPFLIAAPWFLYALIFHFQWFWKEQVLTEILGRNAAGVSVASPLENVVFYFERLAWPDPILTIAGGVALLWIIATAQARACATVLLWLGLTALALLVFGYHYHGATYLLPAITALALLAGLSVPPLAPRWGALLLMALLAAEIWKIAQDTRIVRRGTNLTVAPALVSYCDQRRSHRLMIVETDDEFFSATQPLAQVSYGLIGQGRAAVRLPIDYQSLGIIVTSREFDDRSHMWPVFRERLTAMGLGPGLDPRATEVLFSDGDDIRRFILRHPEIDFLTPNQYAPPGRPAIPAGSDHIFTLATDPDPQAPSAGVRKWSCAI
jgi:hypothetical protein